MRTFRFKDYGEYLGTRQLGEKVRNQLLPLLKADERICLDFDGVEVVSNSFADECIAKLLLQMPLDELKQRTTFSGLNDFARKNIALALKRRIKSLSVA